MENHRRRMHRFLAPQPRPPRCLSGADLEANRFPATQTGRNKSPLPLKDNDLLATSNAGAGGTTPLG